MIVLGGLTEVVRQIRLASPKLVMFKSGIFPAKYPWKFTMETGRFSDAQIMAVLKAAPTQCNAQMLRAHG